MSNINGKKCSIQYCAAVVSSLSKNSIFNLLHFSFFIFFISLITSDMVTDVGPVEALTLLLKCLFWRKKICTGTVQYHKSSSHFRDCLDYCTVHTLLQTQPTDISQKNILISHTLKKGLGLHTVKTKSPTQPTPFSDFVLMDPILPYIFLTHC